MKQVNDIYNSIKSSFALRTKLDIAEGSVIDNFINSVSVGINEAYNEIEEAKNPHIFTKLKGSNIDSMGMLVGCARRPDEDDQTYLYRMVNWNASNQCANKTAIEAALTSMTYASNVTYIPLTQGVGTATAYVIPKSLELKEKAIAEAKERLADVISSGSYVDYVVPKMLPVRFVIYMSAARDANTIKSNIESKVKEYVNNIAPGDKLELGQINKIGVNEPNVNYFSISQMYIDNKEYQEISAIQKLEEKFLFDEIIWNMVVM